MGKGTHLTWERVMTWSWKQLDDDPGGRLHFDAAQSHLLLAKVRGGYSWLLGVLINGLMYYRDTVREEVERNGRCR